MAELRGAYGRLPFKEQIAFFRRKVPLTSASWTQLYTSGHDHGFVVAGATRDALVKDFMQSVDGAIAEGKSLGSFQKEFDRIVGTHGWDYNGSRNWRSKVIYDTNMRTSYAAARRHQLLEMTETNPYWQYVHSDAVKHPRPEHQALDGLVLRWDDPFWDTHYPPNGWGCQCKVRALSPRQLRKLGKDGPDTAPAITWREHVIGKDGPTPRTVQVPDGIDPGFEYAPGATTQADWMTPRATRAIDAAPDLADTRWRPVVTTTPADFGRPTRMPLFDPPVPLAPVPSSGASMVQRVVDVLQAPSRTFDVKGLPVTIDAQALGAHLVNDPGRAAYLPLLMDLLENPWEIWTNLYRDEQTGAYELRARIVKAYKIGRGRAMLLVAQAGGGFFESWTFIPARNIDYVNRQRIGNLWYGASESGE